MCRFRVLCPEAPRADTLFGKPIYPSYLSGLLPVIKYRLFPDFLSFSSPLKAPPFFGFLSFFFLSCHSTRHDALQNDYLLQGNETGISMYCSIFAFVISEVLGFIRKRSRGRILSAMVAFGTAAYLDTKGLAGRHLSTSLSRSPTLLLNPGSRTLNGECYTQIESMAAYPQQIVTTRLLYCLQDRIEQLSRMQRI